MNVDSYSGPTSLHSDMRSYSSCKSIFVACCRKQQGGCLTDHVLLIDYLLALQYFRLFRWDCDRHCLLGVNDARCKQHILDPDLVQEYLLELRSVLPQDLFRLAIHLLTFQTTRKWLQDDVDHTADLPGLAANDISIPGSSIAVRKL